MAAYQKSNLTLCQLALLLEHLDFYQALDTGTRESTTDSQRHFVDVARGDIAPATNHEFAYLAYKNDRENADFDLQSLRNFVGKPTRQPKGKPVLQSHGESYEPRGNYKPSKKSKAKNAGGIGILGNSGTSGAIQSPTPKKEKPFARYVKEPWGSRDAWARDKASWKKSH